MTFNKAKEELKWKCWKDKEEKVLRKSGMEESSITSDGLGRFQCRTEIPRTYSS